jgi:hypothetical protein
MSEITRKVIKRLSKEVLKLKDILSANKQV